MANDATLFVAMPLSDLLERFQNMIDKALEKYGNKPPQTPIEELMTIEEVTKFLNVSKVTIHKWKKQKLIPFHRIGRRIYFKKQELINSMHSLNPKKR